MKNKRSSRYWYILVIGAVLATATYAQAQVSQPCFYAEGYSPDTPVIRGCPPLTVTLTNCSVGATVITYDFGVGQERTEDSTFTYTQPGRYTITQFGNFGSDITSADSLIRTGYIEVLPTPAPEFTVTTCRNRTVEVRITDAVYEEYRVDFGDGSAVGTVPAGGFLQHTYPDTAPRSITVTGNYVPGNCGGTNTKNVTPIIDLSPPAITGLELSGAASVNLSFEVSEFLRYRVLRRTGQAGGFTEIATLDNPATGTYTQAITNPDGNTAYTYRVVAADACGNSLNSADISSLPLTVTAENDQIILTWQNATPGVFTQYLVFRNNQPINLIPGTLLRIVDTNVQCPDEYCYQIIGVTATGVQSVSGTACARAISERSPPPLTTITASVENGISVLRWTLPDGIRAREYVILRSENGGAYREIGRTGNAAYADSLSNPARVNYCYQVRYTDACGNTSESGAEACPIRLSQDADTSPPTLTWTPYRDWPAGVQEYVLEKLDAADSPYETIPLAAGAFTYPLPPEPDLRQQVLRYRVRAISGDAPPLVSYSNVVELIQPMQVVLPDAFSPNGDGLNDRFEAFGLFVETFRLVIYNRWGEAVFSAESIDNSWEGTINGQEAPTGTYAYRVEAADGTGRKISRQGKVTLIR